MPVIPRAARSRRSYQVRPATTRRQRDGCRHRRGGFAGHGRRRRTRPVHRRDPQILVTKTADQPSVDETGELVTFTVTVENDTLEPVTIDSLNDDVYGDLTSLPTRRVSQAPCSNRTTRPSAEYRPRHVHVHVHAARRPARRRLQHKDSVLVTVHDNDGNRVTPATTRRHVRPHPADGRAHEAGSARRQRDGRRAGGRRPVQDHHDQHLGRAGEDHQADRYDPVRKPCRRSGLQPARPSAPVSGVDCSEDSLTRCRRPTRR